MSWTSTSQSKRSALRMPPWNYESSTLNPISPLRSTWSWCWGLTWLQWCTSSAKEFPQLWSIHHGTAIKQCLRYLRGTTFYHVTFERSGKNASTLVGYSDISHNVDPDDGKSTTGHIFYFGNSPITWCSQKQDIVALSSYEAEFMTGTEVARKAIWLQDLLQEIIGTPCAMTVICNNNRSEIALTKKPVFYGRSKYTHSRYHFIRECVEKADILTKALGMIKYKEMRGLIGLHSIEEKKFKFKGENIGVNLKIAREESNSNPKSVWTSRR